MVNLEKEDKSTFGMIHHASGSMYGSKCLRYLFEKSDMPTMLNRLSHQENKASPLHFAAIAGNLENVKLILKQTKHKEALVNAQDEMGNAPLHMVALSGNVEVIKVLEKAGADMKITNLSGETPLDFAK
jgi:hypothetical protein